MTTSQLFAATNSALLSGDFVTAREGLEVLSRSADHFDMFCAAECYTVRFPACQREPLAGRIREANGSAIRNGARRALAN